MTPLRRQLRQPRLSEIVAEELRQRILSHQMADGSMLPRQEELLAEFGVSVPSLREAMRILETEGFITIRRGSLGGAVVHQPKPADAAYTFSLVLESQHVSLGDLMSAMHWLEPVCAASAASRIDRQQEVVPHLQGAIDDSLQVIDDPVAFADSARAFHDAVVRTCGNATVKLMVGALESLWTAQMHEQRQVADAAVLPERALREASVEAHRRLAAAIEHGDASTAEALARDHFSDGPLQQAYALSEFTDSTVRSALLRER